MDPAGPDGFWGKQIVQKDWDRGYIPVGATDFERALFDSMVAHYWHVGVQGASDDLKECRLRWPVNANGAIGY